VGEHDGGVEAEPGARPRLRRFHAAAGWRTSIEAVEQEHEAQTHGPLTGLLHHKGRRPRRDPDQMTPQWICRVSRQSATRMGRRDRRQPPIREGLNHEPVRTLTDLAVATGLRVPDPVVAAGWTADAVQDSGLDARKRFDSGLSSQCSTRRYRCQGTSGSCAGLLTSGGVVLGHGSIMPAPGRASSWPVRRPLALRAARGG